MPSLVIQVQGQQLLEELGLTLLPGGFCSWGPTLLASDPLLGAAKTKDHPTDQQILKSLSLSLRQTGASRLVFLGSLFGPSADPKGDLPGLLVPWRSEILEIEIAWVYPKAAPEWDQILDFLEISRVASGAKLGDAELISAKSLPKSWKAFSFIGGLKPSLATNHNKKKPAWAAKNGAFILPSCRGVIAKTLEKAALDWAIEWEPYTFPSLIDEQNVEPEVQEPEAVL